MPLSAPEVHALKLAPEVEGLIPAVRTRWSSRSFSARDVSDADLHRVFEAARWSASAFNEQPWRFVVGRKGTPTHAALVESLMGFNQEWASKAPVLILTLAQPKFSHNGTVNGYALYDLGAAVTQLTLQAAELGMTSHQMAGFDHEKAHDLLAIPEEVLLGTVVALGYQGNPDMLTNERLLALETTARTRKPLAETVFSSWEQPAKLA
jgi:nitroreductase